MVAHLAPLMDAGRAKVYSCDSVAGKAMAERVGSPDFRLAMFNLFHQALAEEIIPAIHSDSGGSLPIVVAGASIGAFNSLAMISRYPHLINAAVCMSGTYAIDKFIGGRFTDDLYYSSPLHFLPGLEGSALHTLRQRMVDLRVRQRGLGGRGRVLGRREGAGRQGASPTELTTGGPATSTTGRPGGRCSPSTSTTCCPDPTTPASPQGRSLRRW